MTFVIRRLSNPVETLPVRPLNATECKMYFITSFPRYRLEMFDETSDGEEIFIVISKHDEHIRFHATRRK